MRKGNLGTIDRLLRFLIGAALITTPSIANTATIQPGLGTVLVVIGAVLIVTAALKTCPVYSLFGWRTCSKG